MSKKAGRIGLDGGSSELEREPVIKLVVLRDGDCGIVIEVWVFTECQSEMKLRKRYTWSDLVGALQAEPEQEDRARRRGNLMRAKATVGNN